MILEKFRKIVDTHLITLITISTISFAIYTYFVLGTRPETFIAIATIALVGATIYLAYFNNKLWLAQDKPLLIFELTKRRKEAKFNSEDPKYFVLYVKNIGRGAAFDIKYSFYMTGKLKGKVGFCGELRDDKGWLHNIPLLSPTEEIIAIEGEIPIALLYPNTWNWETKVLKESPPEYHIERLTYKDINDVKINQDAHVKISKLNSLFDIDI